MLLLLLLAGQELCLVHARLVPFSLCMCVCVSPLGAPPVCCFLKCLPGVACGQAAPMAHHAKQTRVLLLNDMEKLDKTLFRLEQGQCGSGLLREEAPSTLNNAGREFQLPGSALWFSLCSLGCWDGYIASAGLTPSGAPSHMHLVHPLAHL